MNFVTVLRVMLAQTLITFYGCHTRSNGCNFRSFCFSCGARSFVHKNI